MESLVQFIESAWLRTFGGGSPSKFSVDRSQISSQTLAIIFRQPGSTSRRQTLQLAHYIKQLTDILARERSDGHSCLMRGRGDDVALPLQTLESGAHWRAAHSKALGDFGLDDAGARSELATDNQIPK